MRLRYQTRITLVGAVCSGLVIGVVFAALLSLVAQSEFSALDRELTLGMEQAQAEIKELPKGPDFREVAAGYPGLLIRVEDSYGHLILRTGSLSSSESLATQKRPFGSNTLLVSISATSARERMRFLICLALIFWPLLTGFVTLSIWLGAKRTFAPLTSMARQATEIARVQGSFRLPLVYGGEYDTFALELNTLLDRIEKSGRRQEQFAFDAAHELRTPLTIMSGMLQENIRRSGANSTENEANSALLSEVDRLSALVEMLLESARCKVDQIGERCDLSLCLEATAARWLDRYTAQKVQLDVQAIESRAPIATSKMESVIENLLANALRASKEGDRVTLVNRLNGDENEVVIEDEGPGVPQERAEEIFSPFVRLDGGRNRSEGGFGLGLAICKRLVEDHGGTISVSGSGKGGARFVIELPVAS